jgi:Bifunctional DNA primase/polymerase, N-terminal
MVETVLRRGRRRAVGRMAVAAAEYAAMGWPLCPGAYPPGRPHRHGEMLRGCSCDRIGCPDPGSHPMSPAWQVQATADPAKVGRWWHARPEANVILVTGRVFDVLDVPANAGAAALATMERSSVRPGPVAISAGNRALFFVATRGTPDDEDEWWSCNLDCEPEMNPEVAGLRWHCRNSYVLAPPSRHGNADKAQWLRPPDGRPLPDGLRLLGYLADACEGTA